ncbi:MAG: glycosyltransferase [Patescibacteria group bacterium]|nr:glycosyltransferase [Patescibacteria group bacterium]
MNKKVLFISYFFPPLGGAGVIRVTKFVKFLPTLGWDPSVLTPRKGFYPVSDESLLLDIPSSVQVTRIEYLEPCFWFKNRLWQSFLQYFLYPLFLIPDRQILWFLPALWRAYKIIKKEKISLVFTSSSSYSDHLIALVLKKLTGIKWVADFRDEWTESPYAQFFSPIHRQITRYLEKVILNNADTVITISEGLTNSYQRILNNQKNKFITITNGFDKADFKDLVNNSKNKKMNLIYAGTIYGSRKIGSFSRAIDELNLKNIKLEFIGSSKRLSYRQSLKKLASADVLLLILSPLDNLSVMTSKIFEYLALRKPILAIAPYKSGAAKLIHKLKVGEVANPENVEEIKEKLLKLYQSWQKNDLKIPEVNLEKYERKNLTKDLTKIFDQLVEKTSKVRLCLIGNIQSSQNQSLCQYFVQKGYDIHFITTKPAKITGVKTYLLQESSLAPWYFIKSIYKIRKIIWKIQPDIVHGQDLVFAGIWAYLSGFRPYVVTTWGSDVFKFEEFIAPEKHLIRKTLQKADLVTCSSLALSQQAQKIGMPKKHWQLIHFGIDLDIFKNQKFSNQEKIIFCPRAIGSIYNTDILISAFYQISKNDKNVKLALLENIVDENYLLEVEKLIIKYNLVDKVVFWPKVSNEKMIGYYNRAEVVVSLSSSDGCSVSFLEAMATESKIVVTDLPYIREWENGKNFWTVPVKDVEATVIALRAALKYPTSKWQKIGKLNRQLIKERAEIKSNFEKLDQLYRGLI